MNAGAPAVVFDAFGSGGVGVCKGTTSSVATLNAAVAPIVAVAIPTPAFVNARAPAVVVDAY